MRVPYNMKKEIKKAKYWRRGTHREWIQVMNKYKKITGFFGSNSVMKFLFWVVDKFIKYIQHWKCKI